MSLPALALSVLAQLPATVSVNTPVQAVTAHYNYALADGDVYWRANPDYVEQCRCSPRAPKEWTAIDLNAPPDNHATGPSDGFVAIAADDHEILAQTDSGQLWRSDHGQWGALWGIPLPVKIGGKSIRGHLKLPAYSDQISLSVRNKDVLYYEDPYGNQFHWGSSGCTTVLTLNQDGRTITMGDPWFPPDLSRQICGPERGRMKLLSIASSASTTMVLAQDGSVYTRFYDYDSNGGTPFFNYQYFDVPKHRFPGADRKSEFEIRGLPAEDWIKQPRILLHSQARLSKRIAILQNGVGNSAREMRVQGTNADGKNGYYHLQYGQRNWQFRVTSEVIAPDDFIELDARQIENRDRAFAGFFIETNKRGRREVEPREKVLATISSPDVNVHCSPFTMTFTLAGGERFDVLAHTVDAWAAFPEEDPEMHPFFVKKLKVTLELPVATRLHPSEKVRAFVKKYLAKEHLRSFGWAMALDQERAQLRRVSYPFKMEVATTGQFLINLKVKAPVEVKANQGRSLTKAEIKRRQQFIFQMQGAMPVPLAGLDFLSRITTTRYTVPAFKGLPSFEQHLPSILVANEMALLWMEEKAQRQ